MKKSFFLVSELKFLGFILSSTGIHSSPEKTIPIKNWSTPNNVTELQQFLGICTFYHKFIKDFAFMAAPLYQLLKKETDWNFDQECKELFQALKSKLIKLPELAYPQVNVPYDLHCDGSNFAMGAVV